MFIQSLANVCTNIYKNIYTSAYKDPLIKNSIYMIMSNVISLIIGFFFWIIAARYYTPYDIGSVSVILSGTAIISMICTFGFPTALVYFLPRDPKNVNRMINSCFMISIITSSILSLILILKIDIWAPTLKSSVNMLYMMIFIIMSVIETISALTSSMFVAGGRSFYHMIKEAVLNIVKIIPIIILSSLGAIGILLSWTTGLILSTIVGFILVYKLWAYKPIFTVDPIINKILGLSFGNYIAGIVGFIPRSILPIIIMNLISTEAAGYFFIAMTVAGVINTIPQFMARSLLAESYNKEKFWNNVNKAIRFSLCIIIPGLLLFLIFGEFVLNVFNPSYAEHALTSLFILSIASLPLLLNNIFIAVRNSQKKVMSIILNNVSVAGITIVLSIPFIRTMGLEGAALSYLMANTIVAMTVIYRMKNPLEFTLKIYREFVVDFSVIFKKPMYRKL